MKTLTTKRNTITFQEAWEEVFEKTISKDKLYAEVRANRVPHVKIGAKILFRRDTLEEWFCKKEKEGSRNADVVRPTKGNNP